jgi:hypothetical protein
LSPPNGNAPVVHLDSSIVSELNSSSKTRLLAGSGAAPRQPSAAISIVASLAEVPPSDVVTVAVFWTLALVDDEVWLTTCTQYEPPGSRLTVGHEIDCVPTAPTAVQPLTPPCPSTTQLRLVPAGRASVRCTSCNVN